jgi:hypothetical protein
MADVTLKVSEPFFGEVFDKLLVAPGTHLAFKGESPTSEEAGILISESETETSTTKTYLHVPVPWFGVDGEVHVVAAQDVEFNDGDTFTVNELDIAWDKLILKVGVDIPALKFGGFCLFELPEEIPVVGGDCALAVPSLDLFTKAPDIELPLDLSALFGFIVTEISAICSLEVRLDNDNGKEVWAVHADPIAVDADLVDIQDTSGKAGALVQAAVAGAALKLQALFPWTWVADVFLGFMGVPTMSEFVLDVLDIPDDIEEWLMKSLEFSIGIDNLLMEVIFDAILDSEALFTVPKRHEILKEKGKPAGDFGGYGADGNEPAPIPDIKLPRIELPITKPEAHFDADEMVLTFDIEA